MFRFILVSGLVVFLLAVASCGPVAEPEPPSGPIPDIGAMVATAIHAALQPTVENEGQESSPSGDESQIKSAGAAQAPTRTDWTAAAGWTALKENPESPTSASSAGPTVPAPRATPTRRIKPTPTRIRIYVPTLTPTRRVTPTPTPSIVSKHSGSCWTEGEGYTVVTNGRGNTYAVEPIQLRHLPGVGQSWLCGVLRGDSKPAMVPDTYSLVWGYLPELANGQV